MGTPCVVALKELDKVTYVSINYDGYVTGVGAMLVDHFADIDKVRAMIAGGDISILAPNIDGCEGHSFATPVKGQTIYYGRDRGETCIDPQVTDIFGFYRATKNITAYVYENGVWFLVTEPYRKPGEYVSFMDRWVLSDLAPIVVEREEALQKRLQAEQTKHN